jgi:hypothetical protein
MLVESNRRKSRWSLSFDQLESFDVNYNAIQLLKKRDPRKPSAHPEIYIIDAPPGRERDYFIQSLFTMLRHYRSPHLGQVTTPNPET